MDTIEVYCSVCGQLCFVSVRDDETKYVCRIHGLRKVEHSGEYA